MAVEHASRVCDWQENLQQDEMPPEWMWPFSDELDEWFEEVDRRRKEKYGSRDDSGDTETPMMRNELAEGRR